MSSSKASGNRVVRFSGIVDNKVVELSTLVVRKNVIRNKVIPEAKQIQSGKYDVVGMVSHPTLCKSKTAPFIKAWCHPYKCAEDWIPGNAPKLLLSESDFVDPMFVSISPRRETPKWDYFCFTMGGDKGYERKGFGNFIQILPELCKQNLTGIIINYGPAGFYFKNKRERKIWSAASTSSNIYAVHRKFDAAKVASIMGSCRFGIFPNNLDCSPLLMAESLIRDTPVLVNRNILGGWKYINENTGVFFDADNPSESIREITNKKYSAKDWFLSEYGFESSCKRLAEFGKSHFRSFENCSMACLSGLSGVLRKFVT